MAEIVWLLTGLSTLAALGFGLLYLNKPPSPTRAVVKTLFMAPLAIALVLLHAPALLIAAAVASAIGDAVLAFDKPWATPLGILSFLIAQLCYLALFLQHTSALDGPRFIAIAAIWWIAVAFLIWLWPRLGPLKMAVVVYTGAISAMASAAMLLPGAAWTAMIGAASFMASDCVLSAELFRLTPDAPARRITGPVVWWTYVAAQALILWGMSRLVLG